MIIKMNHFEVYRESCGEKEIVFTNESTLEGKYLHLYLKKWVYDCSRIYCSIECWFDGLLEHIKTTRGINTVENLAGLIAACNRRLEKIKEEKNNG